MGHSEIYGAEDIRDYESGGGRRCATWAAIAASAGVGIVTAVSLWDMLSNAPSGTDGLCQWIGGYLGAIAAACALCSLAGLACWWWARNPFPYPYCVERFDVSGRRMPDPRDYVDGLICSSGRGFEALVAEHLEEVARWKEDSERRARASLFAGHRLRQLRSAVDDERGFVFMLYRNQTRYRQRNYVRTPYTVEQPDKCLACDAEWLLARYRELEAIGFETTLSRYRAKDQRRLMTPALRRRVMERDDYTCQRCGKRMRDGVGLQIDHIVPVARGGKTVESNLQVLCSKCNGSKGARA